MAQRRAGRRWGGTQFEVFALNEKMPGGEDQVPNVPSGALRDYGARIGAFRIMDVLSKRGILATATANFEVCDAMILRPAAHHLNAYPAEWNGRIIGIAIPLA